MKQEDNMSESYLGPPRSIRCRIVSWETDDLGSKIVKEIMEGHFGERAFLRRVKGLLAGSVHITIESINDK